MGAVAARREPGVDPMTELPDWLVAWRASNPAAPVPKPAPERPVRPAPASTAPEKTRAGQYWVGFEEPPSEAWAWDGGVRREPVLDHDRSPPRIVRRVGWHVCLRCQKPFWSVDVVSVRLCNRCKGADD